MTLYAVAVSSKFVAAVRALPCLFVTGLRNNTPYTALSAWHSAMNLVDENHDKQKRKISFHFSNKMSKRSERNDLGNIEQASLPIMPIM